jgi:peroxiredoxin Q/BCP|tara:strand:- start:272 stop:763 length:492 start_codon:yes stop_codon:yes gene_type:complete
MIFPFNLKAELSLNDPAPYFELFDQNGNQHKLTDYNGEWLVLYFYPKDDTPGCTTEACSFRDDIYKIRELKTKIIGVSTDDKESHEKFSKKYNLPFPLLSDKDAVVAKSYGSAFKIGPFTMAKRHTFIISPAGKIAMIYRKVDPGSHSNEIIGSLKLLTSEEN